MVLIASPDQVRPVLTYSPMKRTRVTEQTKCSGGLLLCLRVSVNYWLIRQFNNGEGSWDVCYSGKGYFLVVVLLYVIN